MASIVVDFEVLPEDRAGDHSATQVCNELNRQLHDPNSALRSGEFRHFAGSASLSAPGSGILPSEEPRDYPASPPLPEDGGRSNFGANFGHGGGGYHDGRHHADVPVGAMSHAELLDQISQRERQLAHTAAGGHGDHLHRARHPMEAEALEEKCGHLQQRLDEVERQLRESQESARIDRSRAQRFEQNLKDREQLLVHAKEMWMKESARASKLADALTSAEDRLADQERRLQEVSDRYTEAQGEVRQLRHLLDGPDGGGFGGGFAAYSSAEIRSNGYPKVSSSTGNLGSPQHSQFSPPNSSSVVFQPSSAFDQKWDQQPASLMSGPVQAPVGRNQPESPIGTGHLPQVPVLPPLEAETNADRFRHLCLCNDAVLYEDDMLQVGVKTEYRGLEGQIALYYGNKSSAALQAFNVHFGGSSMEEGTLRLASSSLTQQLEAHDQVVQRVSVTCAQPFVDPPQMLLQYLLPDACPRRIQLKFPVVITKFMTGLEMRQEEFFHLWRSQRFVLNEVTSVVNLATRLKAALVHVQRSVAFGGALRLQYGFDPNPDNFVLAGQLADQGGDRESGVSLIRVEVGKTRFQGKARIVVRASDHAIARAVCEAIVLQLTQSTSSGFEPTR